MALNTTSLDDFISSPDTDSVAITASEISTPVTPLTHSGRTSPTSIDAKASDVTEPTTHKKKKKKKSKKSGKAKELASQTVAQAEPESESRPPVLCISRNKHWRYISSYHVRTLFEPTNAKAQPFARALGCNYLWNFLIPF
jgi:hypothetical protein